MSIDPNLPTTNINTLNQESFTVDEEGKVMRRTASLNQNSLVTARYDKITYAYNSNDDIETATYSLSAVDVAVLTFTYDSKKNLLAVERTT